MPKLKDLSCYIELAGSNAKLHEFELYYSDGFVETYVPVPDSPSPFSIHLQSHEYIAPGLAMYVYIDGVLQCNRYRLNLPVPDAESTSRKSLVDFRVRQKEVRHGESFIGRDWSFDKLNIGAADQASRLTEDVMNSIGTIEVVVLRCRGASHPVIRSASSAVVKKGNSGTQKKQSWKKKQDSSPPADADDDDFGGGIFSLFDGAADILEPSSLLDGHHSPGRKGHRHKHRHNRRRHAPPSSSSSSSSSSSDDNDSKVSDIHRRGRKGRSSRRDRPYDSRDPLAGLNEAFARQGLRATSGPQNDFQMFGESQERQGPSRHSAHPSIIHNPWSQNIEGQRSYHSVQQNPDNFSRRSRSSRPQGMEQYGRKNSGIGDTAYQGGNDNVGDGAWNQNQTARRDSNGWLDPPARNQGSGWASAKPSVGDKGSRRVSKSGWDEHPPARNQGSGWASANPSVRNNGSRRASKSGWDEHPQNQGNFWNDQKRSDNNHNDKTWADNGNQNDWKDAQDDAGGLDNGNNGGGDWGDGDNAQESGGEGGWGKPKAHSRHNSGGGWNDQEKKDDGWGGGGGGQNNESDWNNGQQNNDNGWGSGGDQQNNDQQGGGDNRGGNDNNQGDGWNTNDQQNGGENWGSNDNNEGGELDTNNQQNGDENWEGDNQGGGWDNGNQNANDTNWDNQGTNNQGGWVEDDRRSHKSHRSGRHHHDARSQTAVKNYDHYIKPYFTSWNQCAIRPSSAKFHYRSSSRGRRASELYICPEEPLYTVPEDCDLVRERGVQHQVRIGPGSEYVHKTGRPTYLDTMTNPYAVFRFNYRSHDELKRMFDLKDDEFQEHAEEARDRLASMSRDELIAELLTEKGLNDSRDVSVNGSQNKEKQGDGQNSGGNSGGDNGWNTSGGNDNGNDGWNTSGGNDNGNDQWQWHD
ncbi:hypothetical protein NA57DRAFT_55797 [Rhizodiscina lignyota]|uniref:Uncharacterized protein n=1 Tax=Rhizodiscina lignyota TaxID=1504668 RepID=A0A9P4IIE7_9PEZI|nr:hypothetical protein NA57DRAFT_55797 [Rhizodiscina lignyota]